MEVGVLIEKTDIADLQKVVNASPREQVTTVLQRLIAALPASATCRPSSASEK